MSEISAIRQKRINELKDKILVWIDLLESLHPRDMIANDMKKEIQK